MKKVCTLMFIALQILLLCSCKEDTDNDSVVNKRESKKHTALNCEQYYQYSNLSKIEKEAYNRIKDAVFAYENYISLADLPLSTDSKSNIVDCFITDYPQCFWLADSPIAITSDGEVELYYFDGENKDVLSTKGQSILCDREKIKKRRKIFDRTVNNIISKIDVGATDYEKELAIHDYLTQNTDYDRVAEQNEWIVGKSGQYKHPAYDIYSTLVDGNAVCQGYTEAFQYLCYSVGINANQVLGDGHIWNVAYIGGDWYQVDVTWDDPLITEGKTGKGNHKYFNLTSQEMYKAHPTISLTDMYEHLKVPECTATKYAYAKK